MINRQDSRHRIKRTNLTGVVPTAHTASTDFTDGTWLNTDIREAEFFYNIPDKKLWIGTGTSSIEIAQIGSTTSGNSLEQTLSIGNNSGTNNIIMGTATSIKSANFGGQIDLGFMSSFLVLSTDNGTLAESYIFLGTNSWYTGGKTSYLQGIAGNLYLATDGLNNITGSTIIMGANSELRVSTNNVFTLYGSFDSSPVVDVILVKDNFSTPSSSTLNDMPGVFIGSQNSTINAGVYNSVVLGGTGLTAISSNTVYVPDLRIQTGKSISFNYSTLTTDTVSITTIGTFSIATITMVDDQSLSIRGQANGYCAYPNRNMGATFFASFIKYGGTIFQNGTTDIVLKDGYGDGTTPRVWTDGTNIFISIRTFSILTSKFTTSYEILST